MKTIHQPGTIKTDKKVKTGKHSYEYKRNPNFGILVLKPDLKKNKWDNIEDWIRDLIKLDPEDWKRSLYTIQQARMANKNKGYSKTKSRQYALIIPKNLELAIKKYYPEIFATNSSVEQFVKKFPGFRAN